MSLEEHLAERFGQHVGHVGRRRFVLDLSLARLSQGSDWPLNVDVDGRGFLDLSPNVGRLD
jgi:hypothetical protein